MKSVQAFEAGRRRLPCRLVGVAMACLPALASAADGAGDTVTLHFQDRPPYSQAAADGAAAGLVATPAARAALAAGLSVAWQLTPGQRQLALVQQGSGMHCGIGWFRSPEREALGNFSQPLYRDQPFGALVHSASTLKEGSTFKTMLSSDPALLIKEGYSYGPTLDRLIAAAGDAVQRTAAEVPQMARMVAARRAGWMIVAPEEAQVLLRMADTDSTRLRLLKMADVPAGQTRHLYCNRAVPADWLARFDRALAALRR